MSTKCPNKNLKEWKDLESKYGYANAMFMYSLEDDIPNEEKAENLFLQYGLGNNNVNYTLKAVDILQSDKAKQVFEKGAKNNWDLNKILTELQIPKEQKQIILDKNIEDKIFRTIEDYQLETFGETKYLQGEDYTKEEEKQIQDFIDNNSNLREEIITSLLAENSFVVEVNTANKRGDLEYRGEELDWIIQYDNGEYWYENKNDSTRSPLYGTEEEAENWLKSQNIPTDYYSNLTVPGGTNYTENEISTPAIVPSIKGHAQFSTDKGIGWFRSDEQEQEVELTEKELQERLDYAEATGEDYDPNDYLNPDKSIVPSKTRRILEVQSDLFQKGRDKKEIVKKEKSFEYINSNFTTFKSEYGFEVSKDNNGWYRKDDLDRLTNKDVVSIFNYSPTNTTSKKENQFLQLLNKKNNWVTFFVKSIIQDSAKKGYEKVLFPKGDTAAKIEGHETVEGFIKEKEERLEEIKEKNSVKLNKEDLKELESDGYFIDDKGFSLDYSSYTKNDKIFDQGSFVYKINDEYFITDNEYTEEIQQLEKEIENAKAGKLKISSIANFYETTIFNILKKQGYNPVEITDEYGNKWNEVEITSEVKKQQILLNKGDRKKGERDLELREKYFPTETVKSSEILSKISKTDHPLSKLAAHLLTLVEKNDVDVKLLTKEEEDILLDTNILKPDTAGFYRPEENYIGIVENSYFRGLGSEVTILHEILHALSSKELEENSEASKKFKEFYEYLKPKFEQFDKNSDVGYAFKDADEFLVAIFTNGKLINQLLRTPSRTKKFDNIFSEIFDYILSLFKINRKQSSIYNEAFALATSVIQRENLLLEGAENLKRRYGNFLTEFLIKKSSKKRKLPDGDYYIPNFTEAKNLINNDPIDRAEVIKYLIDNNEDITVDGIRDLLQGIIIRYGNTKPNEFFVTKGAYGGIIMSEVLKKEVLDSNLKALQALVNYNSNIFQLKKLKTNDYIFSIDLPNTQTKTVQKEQAKKQQIKLDFLDSAIEENQVESLDYPKEFRTLMSVKEYFGFNNKGYLTNLGNNTIEQLEQAAQIHGLEIKKTAGGAYWLANESGDLINPKDETLYQINSNTEIEELTDTDKALNSKLIKLLSKLGFSVEYLNEIRDNEGKLIDASAKANFVKSIVEVVEGKMNAETLPEEASHIIFELIRNSSLGQSIMNNIESHPVFEEVVGEYGELYNYNTERLKREAAGKMIMQSLRKKFNEQNTPDQTRRQIKWWERILKYLQKLFAPLTSETLANELETNVEIISDAIISEDFSELEMEEITETEELFQFIGNPNPDKVKAIKEKIEKTQNEIIGTTIKDGKSVYERKDGSTIGSRVSDLIEATRRKLYGESTLSGNEATMESIRGTVTHYLSESIMDMLEKGKKIKVDAKGNLDKNEVNKLKSKLLKEVEVELLKNPEAQKFIKGNPKLKFFELDYAKFKNLYNGVSHLHNRIKTTDPGATIMTEVKVESKKRDVAGTIDILVIHSDGSISVADYKTKRLDKYSLDQFDYKQRNLWSAQLAEYVEILKEEYSVSQVRDVMIVPIFVDTKGYNKTSGSVFGKLSMLNDQVLDEAMERKLRYLPTEDSQLGYQNLNDYLLLFKSMQDRLIGELKTGKNTREVKEKLNQLTYLIDKILIENDVTPMFTQIQAISELIETPAEFDKLKLEELTDLMQKLQLFKGDQSKGYFMVSFMQMLKDKLKDTTNKDEIQSIEDSMEEISKWNTESELLINKLRNRIAEVAKEAHNVDLEKAEMPRGFFQRFFSGIIDQSNQVLQAFGRLINSAKEEVVLKRKAAFELITEKDKALEGWSKRTGKSVKDAYKMILNENKNLISKYNKEFWEKFKAARQAGNLTFLSKYVEIKQDKLQEGINNYLGLVGDPDTVKQRRKYLSDFIEFDGDTNNILAVKNSILKNYGANNFLSRFLSLNLKDDFLATVDKNYLNSTYIELLDSKNKEVLDYYNMYLDFNKEFYKLTDGRISFNFVAEIERSTLDNIGESEGFGILKPGQYIDSIKKTLEVTEQDAEFGSFDTDGNQTRTVPLLFSNKLTGSLSPKEIREIEKEVAEEFDGGTSQYTEERKRRIRKKEYENGVKNKSIDLSSSLLLMANSVYEYHQNSQIEDTARAYRNLLLMQKKTPVDQQGRGIVNSLTNKVMKLLNVDNDLVSDFDAFTDMHIYGKKTKGDYHFKLGEKTYSSGKVLNFFMTYLSVKALGLSPILAFASKVGSQANLSMTAAENQFLDAKSLREVNRTLANPLSKKKAKYRAIIDLFEVTSRPVVFDQALKLKKNKLSKALSLKNIFVLHRVADDSVDNQIAIAMLKNYYIDKADGKLKNPKYTLEKYSKIIDKTSKSLYDSIEFNDKTGEISLEVDGVSAEQIKEAVKEFRRIANGVGARVKGTATHDQAILANTHLIGRALMQFRNWMPGLITNRFSNFGFNEALKEYDYGRFRVGMGELFQYQDIKKSLTNFSKLFAEMMGMGYYSAYGKHGVDKELAKVYYEDFKRKNPDLELSLDEFIQLRMKKMQGLATELRIYLLLGLLVTLLAKLGFDDDDDSIQSIITNNIYHAFNRSFLEISFFFDIESAQSIIKSPLPVARLAEDLGRIFDNTADETFDIIFGEDSTQDKTGPFYYTIKNTPIINQLLGLSNYYDRNGLKKKGVLDNALERLGTQ